MMAQIGELIDLDAKTISGANVRVFGARCEK